MSCGQCTGRSAGTKTFAPALECWADLGPTLVRRLLLTILYLEVELEIIYK